MQNTKLVLNLHKYTNKEVLESIKYMKNTTCKTNGYKSISGGRYVLMAVLSIAMLFAYGNSRAAEYNLVVQPIQPPDKTRKAFEPLAEYLSAKTGQTIKLVTAVNFLTYWETMKKNNKYDIILDAAHFTDYRREKMGYVVLAKILDVVSYSLITGEDEAILDADELIGKRVATMGSPSLGAVRLEEMFPNPLRQPVIVEVDNSLDSFDRITNNQALAAIVPTPMVRGRIDVNTVTTTEQVPHMALSVSPKVDASTRKKIRDAMVNASKTPEGKKLLEVLRFPGFEKANNKIYEGYASLLEGVWGY
ncbi:MAG: hypothetical protein BMS9Abin26_0291 [Gammaproteobacteria bacterium]|nr:MAG: hypothetical protein BMS9Abin26_0291 [Gammaproteobacteria bacterium]